MSSPNGNDLLRYQNHQNHKILKILEMEKTGTNNSIFPQIKINKSKISNDVILETSCLAHIECMDIFGVFVTWNV